MGLACAIVLALAAPSVRGSELSAKVARLRSLVGPTLEGSPRHQTCRRSVPGRSDALEPVVERAVRDASIRHGVSPRLIRAVIDVESAGNPEAVSHAGAMGLMQLMPGTARAMGVVCAFDPRQNVLGGTRYLREMRDEMGSWRRALAAYNAGPTRVHAGRIPGETRRYVERVMERWARHDP